jgi:hypothetical protein
MKLGSFPDVPKIAWVIGGILLLFEIIYVIYGLS